MYYAHSAPERKLWEPLQEHLWDVAERAARFAEPFGAAEEARFAGLLHDLGKYSDTFTLRLQGQERGLDHWSAGAWAALAALRLKGTAAALAIQGHHVGLQSPDSLRELGRPDFARNHPLGLKLTETSFETLVGRLETDGFTLPRFERSLFDPKGPPGAGMLDARMLFSALVDADFLETEAHFQRGADGLKVHRTAGPELRPREALAILEGHLKELNRKSQAASAVTDLRSHLLRACLEAGSLPPDLFTLSAPTGAGKTLAMLAFALRHAAEHGLRRIVIAVPFLSIIEQTVRVYRDLLAPRLGDLYVLEHHSLAGTRGGTEPKADGQDDQDRTARLLTENWDAPLVVTTSVQLLESLFANRPSACRKLHRLAESVILLDEVQTLPPQLAVPTLATLSRLAERYRASVVFATATQPAFAHLDAKVRPLTATGWAPKEIVPDDLQLFERARRTRVLWEAETPRSWESLGAELAGLGTALCIVNLKRHAQTLTAFLQKRETPGLFHLSTNMCPAHREKVLAEVRRRLDPSHPQPCLLISTQCVEAGVDVDFPVVFRAFAPLDSIAQAAGRCNRNGRLSEGIVHVFLPEDESYPPGGYEQAARVTRTLLRDPGLAALDLQSTQLFDTYYKRLYDLTGLTEADQGKAKKLRAEIDRLDFATTAELYRLIDQDTVNVLVPYDGEAFRSLREELRANGRLTTGWIRNARPHTVNLYRPKRNDPILAYLAPAPLGRKGERSEDWFVLLGDLYDRDLLGLVGAPEAWIA